MSVTYRISPEDQIVYLTEAAHSRHFKEGFSMSEENSPQGKCTPTDPSIEFDVMEVVRLRLVGALTGQGRELIEAERVALYVVGCARPFSRLLRRRG
jgi:hypothetical protein